MNTLEKGGDNREGGREGVDKWRTESCVRCGADLSLSLNSCIKSTARVNSPPVSVREEKGNFEVTRLQYCTCAALIETTNYFLLSKILNNQGTQTSTTM